MKKIFVILLLVVYTISSIGATIHTHYCMGKLIGSALWHKNQKTSKCEKCGMTEKKGSCCKDEHKYFKLKTDHQQEEKFQSNFTFELPVQVFRGFVIQPYQQNNTVVLPSYHAPPLLHYGAPLHIFYCIYRI